MRRRDKNDGSKLPDDDKNRPEKSQNPDERAEKRRHSQEPVVFVHNKIKSNPKKLTEQSSASILSTSIGSVDEQVAQRGAKPKSGQGKSSRKHGSDPQKPSTSSLWPQSLAGFFRRGSNSSEQKSLLTEENNLLKSPIPNHKPPENVPALVHGYTIEKPSSSKRSSKKHHSHKHADEESPSSSLRGHAGISMDSKDVEVLHHRQRSAMEKTLAKTAPNKQQLEEDLRYHKRQDTPGLDSDTTFNALQIPMEPILVHRHLMKEKGPFYEKQSSSEKYRSGSGRSHRHRSDQDASSPDPSHDDGSEKRHRHKSSGVERDEGASKEKPHGDKGFPFSTSPTAAYTADVSKTPSKTAVERKEKKQPIKKCTCNKLVCHCNIEVCGTRERSPPKDKDRKPGKAIQADQAKPQYTRVQDQQFPTPQDEQIYQVEKTHVINVAATPRASSAPPKNQPRPPAPTHRSSSRSTDRQDEVGKLRTSPQITPSTSSEMVQPRPIATRSPPRQKFTGKSGSLVSPVSSSSITSLVTQGSLAAKYATQKQSAGMRSSNVSPVSSSSNIDVLIQSSPAPKYGGMPGHGAVMRLISAAQDSFVKASRDIHLSGIHHKSTIRSIEDNQSNISPQRSATKFNLNMPISGGLDFKPRIQPTAVYAAMDNTRNSELQSTGAKKKKQHIDIDETENENTYESSQSWETHPLPIRNPSRLSNLQNVVQRSKDDLDCLHYDTGSTDGESSTMLMKSYSHHGIRPPANYDPDMQVEPALSNVQLDYIPIWYQLRGSTSSDWLDGAAYYNTQLIPANQIGAFPPEVNVEKMIRADRRRKGIPVDRVKTPKRNAKKKKKDAELKRKKKLKKKMKKQYAVHTLHTSTASAWNAEMDLTPSEAESEFGLEESSEGSFKDQTDDDSDSDGEDFCQGPSITQFSRSPRGMLIYTMTSDNYPAPRKRDMCCACKQENCKCKYKTCAAREKGKKGIPKNEFYLPPCECKLEVCECKYQPCATRNKDFHPGQKDPGMYLNQHNLFSPTDCRVSKPCVDTCFNKQELRALMTTKEKVPKKSSSVCVSLFGKKSSKKLQKSKSGEVDKKKIKDHTNTGIGPKCYPCRNESIDRPFTSCVQMFLTCCIWSDLETKRYFGRPLGPLPEYSKKPRTKKQSPFQKFMRKRTPEEKQAEKKRKLEKRLAERIKCCDD